MRSRLILYLPFFLFSVTFCGMENSKIKIFVYNAREFDELPFFEKYCSEYGVAFDFTKEAPSPDNYHLAKGYDGISIITTETGPDMIDAMKANGVKVISTRTIGYDHIDVEYAKKAGIGVCNLTYSPATVADYAVMMMLIACRKLPYVMQQAEKQNYALNGKLGRELGSCTIGVIGTGRIGSCVINELSGFGCRILANDVMEKEDVKRHAEYTDLDTLLKESDIITLHAPALDDTWHMINEHTISKMKDGVIIINCARGSLIDTDALIAGLQAGKIGFAGLDVIENEFGLYYNDLSGVELDNKDIARLKSFDNVFLSPHMAFYTDEAVANMVEGSVAGIVSYLTDGKYPYIIR